ncbi:phosphatidylserine decarboxylase [Sporothrix schenckii 1099-18]|uniref:Phosphatidylserine decarboxylase proenzyme 2 n=1 Tax=Sporothrix schenckii 1099-18 TaxID=1397361 RepID=A0A0F2LWF6_SPOSC|nr:phosphatidylserine decarboxylase [Sporothrix schenckii 1099-18]KJR81164.1 phosphatidylserine decarboxylase [Sporothrix schenckii 1099-18]
MVRIIPNRLKPSSGNSTTSSTANSRSASPQRGSKGDPAFNRDTGLHVHVVIIKARNLAAKDRGGTSDPYLVLSLGDAKHATHSVSKTLNPEWNEICQLPINGVSSLILDVCCWDKDRFGKDYLGEFDLALEEIFVNDKTEQEPRWYPLKSKRPGRKTGVVSGEVLLQFTLFDITDRSASSQQVIEKFNSFVRATTPDPEDVPPRPHPRVPGLGLPKLGARRGSSNPAPTSTPALTQKTSNTDDYEDEDAYDDEPALEDEDPSKSETVEKRKRRLRIKGLKKKRRENPYEFINGGGDVLGIVFLEIKNITDLPPESNLIKTTFDMDPFVVTSLGRKTFRTKTINHNLNPVFNEKMIYQVLAHEQTYSFSFTVIDRDKYSGNDFIASASLPLKEFIDRAPKADPETGLYDLREPPEYVPLAQRGRFKRLGLSRSSSSQSLTKMSRPTPTKTPSASAMSSGATALEYQAPEGSGVSDPSGPQGDITDTPQVTTPSEVAVSDPMASPGLTKQISGGGLLTAEGNTCSGSSPTSSMGESGAVDSDEPGFTTFTLPLKMKNLEKWEDKHNPQLFIRAKYMPYPALRQQFWRAMLKQYDTDESGKISKVELSTMLDTLGSTLRESTIDSFFQRFKKTPGSGSGGDDDWADLTIDETVICLEDQLDAKPKPQQSLSVTDKIKDALPDSVVEKIKPAVSLAIPGQSASVPEADAPTASLTSASGSPEIPAQNSYDAEMLGREDLDERGGEEHVVEIRECPICHQPRLNKRKDADIITHIATCASQDWRQVNNLVMGGFVTSSQAQRKWYSKVITKISYGGYKIGANSANILVQDRITGQINEEKMSVYVRLGIRLLYKGLRSNNMENKRIRKLLKGLSVKQGRKYDDPISKQEIQKFINFHQLDMSEVLLPLDEFKTFNEFFYRALKPDARPCSAPNNPRIIVSPADCRSVVFNRVDAATKVWIKGREFSVKRLLGDVSADEASRYENGALGIFRLAPQDYHRFHIPVDGVLGKPRLIAGEYYTVNPMAIRSALDVYGENVRVVVPIESETHGRVMVVCVGAMMVGSTVITRKEGEQVKRAEELGYFKFGGSTLVLLFEEGRMKFDDDLVENSSGALETLIRVGMSVGHSPNEPQWRQDMPKNETEVTEQDKIEAKRRIQGSTMAEDITPEDSGGDDLLS